MITLRGDNNLPRAVSEQPTECDSGMNGIGLLSLCLEIVFECEDLLHVHLAASLPVVQLAMDTTKSLSYELHCLVKRVLALALSKLIPVLRFY